MSAGAGGEGRPGAGGRPDKLPLSGGRPRGLDHSESVEQRRKLEIFFASYKSLEGSVSILAGFLARSAALTGFGIASLIQMISALAFLWGLRPD